MCLSSNTSYLKECHNSADNCNSSCRMLCQNAGFETRHHPVHCFGTTGTGPMNENVGIKSQKHESALKVTETRGTAKQCNTKIWASLSLLQDSITSLSPGRPKMRRFLSIDPTARYFASGPNFAEVTLPVPDKSGKVLIQFHSDFTLATW